MSGGSGPESVGSPKSRFAGLGFGDARLPGHRGSLTDFGLSRRSVGKRSMRRQKMAPTPSDARNVSSSAEIFADHRDGIGMRSVTDFLLRAGACVPAPGSRPRALDA